MKNKKQGEPSPCFLFCVSTIPSSNIFSKSVINGVPRQTVRELACEFEDKSRFLIRNNFRRSTSA